jgi:hypothetical protein
MLRIGHHRRATANHTWHVDLPGRPGLFVKANPNRRQAQEEINGHARISSYYLVPDLLATHRIGSWTLLVYQRWPHLSPNHGLLVDELTAADTTGDLAQLDACLTDLLGHYRTVLAATLHRVPADATIGKLYRDRADAGERLDQYYSADAPWLVLPDDRVLRPSTLADNGLIINGRQHQLDPTDLIGRLRTELAGRHRVWAALSQGDPTDLNLGWSPTGGPVWFDPDVGGLNAVAGEFACFLIDQRLHGAWLTPTYNPAAYRDHPATLAATARTRPRIHVQPDGRHALRIDYRHRPSLARRHALNRYLQHLVFPIAAQVGVDDVLGWLRPYLAMRLLAVYNLVALQPDDTALCLALLAELLSPEAHLDQFLGLSTDTIESLRVPPNRTGHLHRWPASTVDGGTCLS